jgi:segregation and condensation protein A
VETTEVEIEEPAILEHVSVAEPEAEETTPAEVSAAASEEPECKEIEETEHAEITEPVQPAEAIEAASLPEAGAPEAPVAVEAEAEADEPVAIQEAQTPAEIEPEPIATVVLEQAQPHVAEPAAEVVPEPIADLEEEAQTPAEIESESEAAIYAAAADEHEQPVDELAPVEDAPIEAAAAEIAEAPVESERVEPAVDVEPEPITAETTDLPAEVAPVEVAPVEAVIAEPAEVPAEIAEAADEETPAAEPAEIQEETAEAAETDELSAEIAPVEAATVEVAVVETAEAPAEIAPVGTAAEAPAETAPVEAEVAGAVAIAVAAVAIAPEPVPAPAAQTPAPQPPVKRPIKLETRDKEGETAPFSVIVSEVYDGPLDLLLDLIRKQDIDIYDIPIAQITAQFLAYVNQLKASDVDVAGEFIYTASLLIHIKSKMLLPRAPSGPEDAADDPRRELVERLLEHERFKNAAQMLQQKQMLEAATWTNPGAREFRGGDEAEPEIAADTTDLMRVFRDILERARNRPVISVQDDSVTVGQMIQFLSRRLTMEDKPIALRRLLSQSQSERALIAMFLALLELVRLQAILLRQDLAFSEIFIKKHTDFETVMNEAATNTQDDWR